MNIPYITSYIDSHREICAVKIFGSMKSAKINVRENFQTSKSAKINVRENFQTSKSAKINVRVNFQPTRISRFFGQWVTPTIRTTENKVLRKCDTFKMDKNVVFLFIYLRIFLLENNIAVAWKRNLSKTTAFLEIYNRL